jgi:hypothetical protein
MPTSVAFALKSAALNFTANAFSSCQRRTGLPPMSSIVTTAARRYAYPPRLTSSNHDHRSRVVVIPRFSTTLPKLTGPARCAAP